MNATSSSPTTAGMMGVSDGPVSKPAARRRSIMMRVFRHSCSRRQSSSSMTSTAAETEATEAGGMLAEKIRERAMCRMKWTVSASEAMKPPTEASDLLNVPMIRWTRSLSPKWSQVPRPWRPRTPMPCASSTITTARCLSAMSQISGTLAMSPCIEKMPSTTTSLPLSSQAASVLSSATMSLCRYLRVVPKLRRQPSRIEAWSMRSMMTLSLRPTRAKIVPRFTIMPVEKTMAASLPTSRASFSSSSTWMSRVPLRKRDPAQPEPYLSTACLAASLTRGWFVRPR